MTYIYKRLLIRCYPFVKLIFIDSCEALSSFQYKCSHSTIMLQSANLISFSLGGEYLFN